MLAYGTVFHGQRLLILTGNAGIEAGEDCFGGLLPLAENLPGFPDAGPSFYGHFTKLPADGRRVSFSARRDSS
jgi:hypothetical protein